MSTTSLPNATSAHNGVSNIGDPHLLDHVAVCEHHEVDPNTGLTHDVVVERQQLHGPNALPTADVVPAWKKFLAQFNDTLILILICAAVVSAVISQLHSWF